MKIVKTTGRSVIQSWPKGYPVPAGYAVMPDGVDLTGFRTYKGFVTLTVEDGAVVAITPDVPAYEAWMAERETVVEA